MEIEAFEVRIVAVNFKSGPTPRVRAEAYFNLPVTDEFGNIDLKEWQNENSPLLDGLSFFWSVGLEGTDLALYEHQGSEFAQVNLDDL